jgi:hypothetical protein
MSKTATTVLLTITPRQRALLCAVVKSAIADGRSFEGLKDEAFIDEAKTVLSGRKSAAAFYHPYDPASRDIAKNMLAVYEQIF